MTATSPTGRRTPPRQLLNKVPEVTVWFWIIKVLCTTVGESFADYVNETLGVGLVRTSVIFTVALVVALAVQMRLRRYVPAAYWVAVVVVSVAGTLYTDILTDKEGVPLWISTVVFSVTLAVVFGTWYVRERTLSIHSIVTTPREGFYWLAVLVTFALGTATGDWTLELTGWGPGKSVLLPLALIAIIAGLWRYGADPVLAFWLAYILTRPLGANIGDWLASPSDEQGLGLGTFGTSVVFLGAILATVVYLTVSHVDVIDEGSEDHQEAKKAPPTANSRFRERVSLAVLAAAAIATVALLAYANSKPHVNALEAEEGAAPSCSGDASSLSADEASRRTASAFPADDVSGFRTIAADIKSLVGAGDQSGAASRATDLETAWDDAESRLVDEDCLTWTYVDGEVDDVLSAVRADSPDEQTETDAVSTLLATLG